MKRRFFVFFTAITIPALLALTIWQSNKFYSLKQELNRLEQTQNDWVENNESLIADIAELSSPKRIEHKAKSDLGLRKIRPENVLLIKIEEGKGHEY